MCLVERVFVPRPLLESVIRECRYDVRKVILQLHFWFDRSNKQREPLYKSWLNIGDALATTTTSVVDVLSKNCTTTSQNDDSMHSKNVESISNLTKISSAANDSEQNQGLGNGTSPKDKHLDSATAGVSSATATSNSNNNSNNNSNSNSNSNNIPPGDGMQMHGGEGAPDVDVSNTDQDKNTGNKTHKIKRSTDNAINSSPENKENQYKISGVTTSPAKLQGLGLGTTHEEGIELNGRPWISLEEHSRLNHQLPQEDGSLKNPGEMEVSTDSVKSELMKCESMKCDLNARCVSLENHPLRQRARETLFANDQVSYFLTVMTMVIIIL